VGESFLIVLREGFEASLVVAIVLAAANRSPGRMARWVWWGTGAAILLSAVVGIVIHVTIDGLEGEARANTFAGICLLAAALLTWMIFWMRKHSRSLKGELEGKVAQAGEDGLALALVAFAAVAREGLETALFLLSTTTQSDGADVLLGGLIGLAGAIALGVLVYQGSRRFPMRLFFQVTGVLIIVFAAGLLAKAVMFMQASALLSTFEAAAYNVTQYAWLTNSTQTGRFLAGIFGWDPRPSIEQVIAYVGYLVPVLYLFLRPDRPSVPKPTPAPDDADLVVSQGV
jgi:high-affinity iron transporter